MKCYYTEWITEMAKDLLSNLVSAGARTVPKSISYSNKEKWRGAHKQGAELAGERARRLCRLPAFTWRTAKLPTGAVLNSMKGYKEKKKKKKKKNKGQCTWGRFKVMEDDWGKVANINSSVPPFLLRSESEGDAGWRRWRLGSPPGRFATAAVGVGASPEAAEEHSADREYGAVI